MRDIWFYLLLGWFVGSLVMIVKMLLCGAPPDYLAYLTTQKRKRSRK